MQLQSRPMRTANLSGFRLVPSGLLFVAAVLLLTACTVDDEEPATGESSETISAPGSSAQAGDDGQQNSEEAAVVADDEEESSGGSASESTAAKDPEPPAIDEKGLTVYFPRLAPFDETVEVVTIDTRGPLALDERGCLRLGDESGDVIIWPPDGFTVDVVDGDVTLIDEVLDLPIARVGEWIALGGERGVPRPRDVMEGSREAVESAMDHPLPEACADADRYVFPGGEPGGGIQRVDPDPALAEIEGWDSQE